MIIPLLYSGKPKDDDYPDDEYPDEGGQIILTKDKPLPDEGEGLDFSFHTAERKDLKERLQKLKIEHEKEKENWKRLYSLYNKNVFFFKKKILRKNDKFLNL